MVENFLEFNAGRFLFGSGFFILQQASFYGKRGFMNKIKIAQQLGLWGWDEMDSVILASLAAEMPVLLIGSHGSGKSMFFERLSEVMGFEYRFYNASLLNYDDLVGIPVPSADYKSLNFISDKASLWDAQVVFFARAYKRSYKCSARI